MKTNAETVKQNLTLIGLVIFLNNVNLYNVTAVLLYKKLTGSFASGMSVFAVATVAAAVFELPTGILSDKIGRKKTVVLGSVCSVAAGATLFFANGYFTLMLFAVISGAEVAFFSGNNDAYVYDSLKAAGMESEYAAFIGRVGSMAYLAAAVSGLAGAGVLYFSSYKLITGLSVIPKVAQLAVSLRLGETEKPKAKASSRFDMIKTPLREVLKNRLLLKKVLSDGIMQSCNEACFQFRAAFYKTVWPLWAVGAPGVLSNVGAFISNRLAGRILKLTTRKKYWLISNLYSILSNIAAVLMNNVISPLVMITNSLCSGDFISSEAEQRLYRDEYRAAMGSFKNLIQGLLFSVFSVLLGLAADGMGIAASFVIFQLIKVIPAIINGRVIEKLENRRPT